MKNIASKVKSSGVCNYGQTLAAVIARPYKTGQTNGYTILITQSANNNDPTIRTNLNFAESIVGYFIHETIEHRL